MKSTSTILIVCERFYPEEFAINELASEWVERGYNVKVLTQTPSYPFGKLFKGYANKLFQKSYWNGIEIARVFSLMGYNRSVLMKILNYLCFVFFASIASLWIARKVDQIYIYQVGPLTQAVPALLAHKLYKKPCYIWTQDIWPDSVYAYGIKKNWLLSALLGFLVKFVYSNCNVVFISCKGFEAKIRNYVSNARIEYAPQWSPKSLDFCHHLSEQQLKSGFNFTFAGNIGKVQNLERIISAFNRLGEISTNVNLNIIGDGSNLEKLKALVKTNLIENVYFWGRKPIHEMSSWLSGSDILIISLIDNPIFSLTVPAKFQAYLAAEKPIFCVMKGEVASLVADYDIGIIADPDSLFDIERGFIKFINERESNLLKMGKNARNLLEKEYNIEKIINSKTRIIFEEGNE